MESTKEERHELRAYLDQLLDDLRKNLNSALMHGDIDAIHDARVATRRLSSALELFEPQVSPKLASRFKKSLKKIRRVLGPLRDLDVMLSHLAKMPRAHAEAAAYLRQSFIEEREKLLQESRDIDAGKILGRLGNWWGLRHEIADQDAKTLLRNALARLLDEFCIQADAQTAGGEVAVARNPHELRIAGKELRYTLELASEDGFDIDKSVSRVFKKLQDQLGLWHDFVVASERCLELSNEQQLGYRNGPLQLRILRLAETANRRAETQLQHFVKFWREHGMQLRETIAAAISIPEPPAPAPELEPPPKPDVVLQSI